MQRVDLEQCECLYFLGIGGIGMSALARYFKRRGKKVYGYDRTSTALTKQLEAEGMQIQYTENVTHIPSDIELVVYTPAIPKTHSAWPHLKALNIPILKRSEVLGILSRQHRCIAVAGTHGKTSTSTIVTHVLREGGIDCTAFLGGIARNYDTNFVEGQSAWMVVEADEYDRSFLQLHPELAVILSMDVDHLDIYGTAEEMHRTYQQFATQIDADGLLLYKEGVSLEASSTQVAFGASAPLRIENIRVEAGYFVFDWHWDTCVYRDLKFALPGAHNAWNAAVALAIAHKLGVREADMRRALLSFKGIQRRFDWVYRDETHAYIDDYAHHPEELKVAIQAARQLFPTRPLHLVFQPHLYSRTRDFMDEFAAVLSTADVVRVLDIYPARELPIEGIDSQALLSKVTITDKKHCSKADLLEELAAAPPSLLMTLGAGDINTCVAPIQKLYKDLT